MQQAHLAHSPAPQDDAARARIARLALLFICSTSPKSVEFARRKMDALFGYAVSEAELRAAQQILLVESTQGLTAFLQPTARKP